jgi:hypothetical protein
LQHSSGTPHSMQHCNIGCSTPQQALWQLAGNVCGSSHLAAHTTHWCCLCLAALLSTQLHSTRLSAAEQGTRMAWHARNNATQRAQSQASPRCPPPRREARMQSPAASAGQANTGTLEAFKSKGQRPHGSRSVGCHRAQPPVQRPTQRRWPVNWHMYRARRLITPGPATGSGNPPPCPRQRRAPGPASASLTGGRGRGCGPCAGRPPARCAHPGARAAPRAARSARRVCRRPARGAGAGGTCRNASLIRAWGSPGSSNKKPAHGGSLQQGHRQRPPRQRVEQGRFRARAAPPP